MIMSDAGQHMEAKPKAGDVRPALVNCVWRGCGAKSLEALVPKPKTCAAASSKMKAIG